MKGFREMLDCHVFVQIEKYNNSCEGLFEKGLSQGGKLDFFKCQVGMIKVHPSRDRESEHKRGRQNTSPI